MALKQTLVAKFGTTGTRQLRARSRGRRFEDALLGRARQPAEEEAARGGADRGARPMELRRPETHDELTVRLAR